MMVNNESKENGFAKYLTGKTGSVTLNIINLLRVYDV